MTNAEKFKQVFGIGFEEFEKEDLKYKYSKLKKYKATLVSWRFDREPLTIYVNASNKTQARAKVREEDLYRIYWLRDNGYAPYVMIYNKDLLPQGHELRKLQRWVNNRFVFWSVKTFEEYQKG